MDTASYFVLHVFLTCKSKKALVWD